MIEEILKTLDFKSEEIKTYLSLLDSGAISAGDLSKKMGIPRPTLYGYLEKITQGGLATQSFNRGVKIFVPEQGEKIRFLYKRKIDELKSKEKSLDKIIPELDKLSGMGLLRPRMHLFEGRSGIQNLMEDLLKYENQEACCFWPINDMLDIITADFLEYHNKERIKKNISYRSIWQFDKDKFHNPPFLGTGDKYLREIRIAPYNIDFKLGCWIYADKAIFISSKAESFGFMIESKEFFDMQMAQHNLIWQLSKPHKISPRGKNIFFDEL